MSDHSLSEIVTNEFDYNYLVELFKSVNFPRNKISYLLKTGRIIRVKKGLYVKAGSQYSVLVLANLIYGPSYISQEYALATYGMMAERVHAITSMTLGRRKSFATPVGTFSYEPLAKHIFTLGIRRAEESDTQSYLIATPEKALADLVAKERTLATEGQLERFLEQDRRVSMNDGPKLSVTRLQAIAQAYDTPSVHALVALVRKRKNSE